MWTVFPFNVTSLSFYSLYKLICNTVGQCFSTFCCWWTPFEFDLSVWRPHPLWRCYLRGKKLLYFHIVNLYIRIYLYYSHLQYFIVFKYFVRCNTLFTYTSKSTLMIIGIVASQCVLWARETRARFECPVELWPLISKYRLPSKHGGGYILVTANKSPNWNQIQPDKTWKEQ